MTANDDFALYDARYAENFLGDGYPCFFCGVHGEVYTDRMHASNLLCEACAKRYDTPEGHVVMCERIQKKRSTRNGDLRWDEYKSCHDCLMLHKK